MTSPFKRVPLRLSLRTRIALKVFALAAAVQVTLSIVRMVILDSSLKATADSELRAHADRFVGSLPSTPSGVSRESLGEIGHSTAPFLSNFVLTVYDENGIALVSSRDPPIDLGDLGVDLGSLSSATVVARPVPAIFGDASRTRVVVRRFTGRDSRVYVLAAATDYVAGDWVIKEWIWLLFATTPVGLVAAAVVGWLIAGSAVAPLVRLGRLAQNLGPTSLNAGFDLGPAGRELSEVQDQLNRALRRIDDGYERQSRFISNVSHELRTPIATLLTEAQTLREVESAPAEVQRFIRSTQDEMRRLGRLLESFLTLSRVRDGTPKSVQKRYPVNDLVIESVASCRRIAEQSGVKLFPQLFEYTQSGAAEVVGDPELLCTMLDNIVRNAVRFSPKGESVHIQVLGEESFVLIVVRDAGPGIPADLIERVFDRYYQVPAEHKGGQGSGLGLSIAQGVAELHGGSIQAGNAAGGGCTFTIRLPRWTGVETLSVNAVAAASGGGSIGKRSGTPVATTDGAVKP